MYYQFTFPMNGWIVSKVVSPSGHAGYDMRGPTGQIGDPIYASFAGKVSFTSYAGTNPSGANCSNPGSGYGNYLQIDHGSSPAGSIATIYAHFNSFAPGIAGGTWVATGQLLGYAGTTGHTSCTPHLHWEIKNTATNIWSNFNAQLTTIPVVGTIPSSTQILTAQGPLAFSGGWVAQDNVPGTTKSFTYGGAGDIPVMGDWNSDGWDTPGVVRYNRTSGGLDWLLTNKKLTTSPVGGLGAAQTTLSWGVAGDSPLVGNWNSSVGDEPGVVRRTFGSPLEWFLIGATSVPFTYGDLADQAVGGDWDSSGGDTPGVARALYPNGNGYTNWYLNNEFDGTASYAPFVFGLHLPGNPVDRASTMAWSCCGNITRPVIVRNGADVWYLSNSFTGSVAAIQDPFGGPDDYGIPADWDNDAADDYIIAI